MNPISKTVLKPTGYTKDSQLYLKIAIFCFLIFSLAACGKKGPPIPPETLPLPPVTGLEAGLIGNTSELSWTVQRGKNVPAPDGFRIYRSKRSILDSEECPGCPDVFEMVAEMATAFSLWGRTESRFNYSEDLEADYIYRYKISAYTDSGMISEWSDTVEVVPGSESPGSGK